MPVDCVLGVWHVHEPELKAYLLTRLEESHAVDDLLQDTFLKALRQGADFCQIDNPRAWFFQVVRNSLIDRARQAKSHIELPEDLPAPAGSPREPVDNLDACLLRNITEMRPEDREVIEQCDLRGAKQQAFADTHGLSLAAVKSRLLRARKRLRESLKENCQVKFDADGRVCCHVPRD